MDKTVQFEDFVAHLDAIFDQVEAHGEVITVERAGKLFTLRPKRQRPRKGHRLTRDDALWDIVGIADSGEPGNRVASNKYRYVADAIASHFERPQESEPHQPRQPQVPAEAPSQTVSASLDEP